MSRHEVCKDAYWNAVKDNPSSLCNIKQIDATRLTALTPEKRWSTRTKPESVQEGAIWPWALDFLGSCPCLMCCPHLLIELLGRLHFTVDHLLLIPRQLAHHSRVRLRRLWLKRTQILKRRLGSVFRFRCFHRGGFHTGWGSGPSPTEHARCPWAGPGGVLGLSDGSLSCCNLLSRDLGAGVGHRLVKMNSCIIMDCVELDTMTWISVVRWISGRSRKMDCLSSLEK